MRWSSAGREGDKLYSPKSSDARVSWARGDDRDNAQLVETNEG